jgi:hypothetical protein
MESVFASQRSIEAIERLVEEEKVAVEFLRAKATRSGDTTLGEIYTRVLNIRVEFIGELEARLNELRSQAEITAQINAMFL